MSVASPTPLGLKKSFGFGDRLGLATPGHFAAASKYDFAPIYAQQSIREMTRTDRTPDEVMQAAIQALEAAGYTGTWGADADHLKTQADVQVTQKAGFCFFTIDPSEFVNNAADNLPQADLETEVAAQVKDGIFESAHWMDEYLGKSFEVSESFMLSFSKEQLLRAATKYARAIAYCKTMTSYIEEANGDKPYEIEVSVDETDSPTTPEEHLFFALELKKRGVQVVSLAPRFIGDFEKGIDYKGDLGAFEASLKKHVAISKFCGPYKISIHSGSDKFSIYPTIGRLCGDLLHVKTAGTSYLEALRAICRADQELFKEIICYSAGRFSEDKATYHISVSDEDVASWAHQTIDNLEDFYLNQVKGRQMLHVTFGSVLTLGKMANGRSFREAVMETLERESDLYKEVLDIHLSKHLALLNQG